MERPERIELSMLGWKPNALPLGYDRLMRASLPALFHAGISARPTSTPSIVKYRRAQLGRELWSGMGESNTRSFDPNSIALPLG